MYAVNIADLTTLEPAHPLQFTLAGVMPAEADRTIVSAEPSQIDGMAVILHDAPPEQIQAIIAIAHRGLGKWKATTIRFYQAGRGGSWVAVPRSKPAVDKRTFVRYTGPTPSQDAPP